MTSLVARGSAWTLGGFGATLLLRLLSNVILARLLFPEAFGLMALTAVVLQGLHMFSDLGIAPSITQHERGDDSRFLNTAWTLQVLRGGVLWLLLALLAVPFADLYGQPELALILPVAGLGAILAGFNSTSLLTERRHIRVKSVTIVELAAQAISTAVMIVIALVKPTVWALVAGTIAANVVTLLLSHLWIRGTHNRFLFDRAACGELLHFGKWIFLSTLLTFIVGQGDRFVFGKIASIELLGVYAIASVFATIPMSILSRIGQSVVFPAYCRVLRSEGVLLTRFHDLRAPFVAFGLIATSTMCVVAPLLIDLLYDPRYVAAGWMLQLLLVGVALKVFEEPNGLALLAHGNAKSVALGSVAKLVAMILLMTAGFLGFGIPGLVAGYASAEGARLLVSTVLIKRHSIHTGSIDTVMIMVWMALTGFGLWLRSAFEANLTAPLAVIMALGCVTVGWGIALWLLYKSGLVPGYSRFVAALRSRSLGLT